jgi:L-2-hydroxyglutarate oxidase LhgO
MSITDERFLLHFDCGVGYIAVTGIDFPNGIEFWFNENPDTEKYVGYLVDHNNEVFLDFAVTDLEPTRQNIHLALRKAFEYLANR